jgi:hypothetical protein
MPTQEDALRARGKTTKLTLGDNDDLRRVFFGLLLLPLIGFIRLVLYCH